MFITFEGADGSGKTTIISKLSEKLKKEFPNLDLLLTREPGGKDLREAEKIREIILDSNNKFSPVVEAILYSASRRIHLEKVIWPALKNNKIVICDRYIDSFYAYQGFARDLGLDYVQNLTNLVINNTIPDLTFFFDISPTESQKRRENNRLIHDRLEQESIDFHQKVYDGYLTLAKQEPKRFIIIDATQSIEQVLEQTFNALKNNSKFIEFLKLNYE
ncbi:dTMP kinase [Mycoplasmopsis gallinarum]|uniref:Thymidylate kinase n=1 Tax=Mycoplasmopsis gallinarum TaxID=29557 RepID=A0A168R7J9_9BACT|nr:dTMP kinase [Mycoplasmopsis gallinarum]OAB48682.1 Thymidylate kinase [Mycoplasmopsis gallinarum]